MAKNPNKLISKRCRDRWHDLCRSVNCICGCHRHDRTTSEEDSGTLEDAVKSIVMPAKKIYSDKEQAVLDAVSRMAARGKELAAARNDTSVESIFPYATQYRIAEANVSRAIQELVKEYESE